MDKTKSQIRMAMWSSAIAIWSLALAILPLSMANHMTIGICIWLFILIQRHVIGCYYVQNYILYKVKSP